jgi:hypothetical protein
MPLKVKASTGGSSAFVILYMDFLMRRDDGWRDADLEEVGEYVLTMTGCENVELFALVDLA